MSAATDKLWRQIEEAQHRYELLEEERGDLKEEIEELQVRLAQQYDAEQTFNDEIAADNRERARDIALAQQGYL